MVGSDQHRGFAFVEFGSKGEAKRAFDALVHSTHLYGRRLVLEWAKSEETVDELRTKTTQKFSGNYKESKHSKKKIMKALEEGTPLDAE
uniref:RRM domain-containing protein n=1 Tax=Acrobeloides nanus TaxID=290746 RepID=A0A914DKS0_9BILA